MSNGMNDHVRDLLLANDVAALLPWSITAPSRCGHDYPSFHRVGDFVDGDLAVRVSRCAACGEQFFLTQMDAQFAAPDEPGVPLELTGESLNRWIADELEDPAKGEIDWEQYLKKS